jgi:FtsZ-binding cell division protein ZapB
MRKKRVSKRIGRIKVLKQHLRELLEKKASLETEIRELARAYDAAREILAKFCPYVEH